MGANTEAFFMTRVLIGKLQLLQFKDIPKTKIIVEEIEALLEEVEGVGKVHGHYYLLATELYKTEGDHANYYRSALRYLGFAALLGKDVYNFGELLAHPILSSLNGTPNAWLVDLLLTFNSGKVQSYENLRSQWTKQPDLNQNQEVLYEKLCLLVLMEMTFRRDANDRQITFNDVSEQTGLNIDKVELLVMKALSKGLVKGHIDP